MQQLVMRTLNFAYLYAKTLKQKTHKNYLKIATLETRKLAKSPLTAHNYKFCKLLDVNTIKELTPILSMPPDQNY